MRDIDTAAEALILIANLPTLTDILNGTVKSLNTADISLQYAVATMLCSLLIHDNWWRDHPIEFDNGMAFFDSLGDDIVNLVIKLLADGGVKPDETRPATAKLMSRYYGFDRHP